MKTFRLIRMAFMAVLLSVNFAACSSSDDEPGDNPNENGGTTEVTKKLVKITLPSNYHIMFEYDANGKLSRINDPEIGYINYIWADNAIIESEVDDYHETVHNLKNGLVVSNETDNGEYGYFYKYSYNSSGNVSKIVRTYSDEDDVRTYTLTWENNKLVKLHDDANYEGSNGRTYEYVYSGKTCKGWAPVPAGDDWAWHIFENHEIFYVHPELVGFDGTQLPDKMLCNGEVEYEYSYIFDEEGYVVRRTCTDPDDGDKRVFTYTWE